MLTAKAADQDPSLVIKKKKKGEKPSTLRHLPKQKQQNLGSVSWFNKGMYKSVSSDHKCLQLIPAYRTALRRGNVNLESTRLI